MLLSAWLVYVIVFVFGLLLGSYLNSWIWRIHENKWKWGGRSMCVCCSRQLAWFENIPLLSFIILKGKCRTCQAKIPVDYFLVELGTAIIMGGVVYFDVSRNVINNWQIWRDLFFSALLVVVFVYDLKYYLIISGVVYAGAIIAFFVNHFILGFSAYSLGLGAVIGSGFFLVQYILSKGRWIGGGDVRLGLMIGVLLGWPNILVALFISYVFGAIVAIPLLLMKKKGMNSEIPFGTFLSIGTLAAMMWGSQIINWYWGLIR